jgi:CBS domain-containing protein
MDVFLMTIKVEKYMSSPVISVYESDNIARVRNLMLRYRISRVVVVDTNHKPVGIISRHDIINYFADRRRAEKRLEEVYAREIMRSPLIKVSPNTSIKKAAELMLKNNINSLPVISLEEGLEGILTATDLLRAFRDHVRGRVKVSEYMRKDYKTARRDHSLFHIIDLLNKDPDRKVVVVEDDRPIGIITESDIVFIEPRSLWVKGSYMKRRGLTARGHLSIVRDYIIPVAEDLMTPDPLTINENEDLSAAADIMYKNRFGALPVVDEKDLMKGLVTKRVIIKALYDLL